MHKLNVLAAQRLAVQGSSLVPEGPSETSRPRGGKCFDLKRNGGLKRESAQRGRSPVLSRFNLECSLPSAAHVFFSAQRPAVQGSPLVPEGPPEALSA